jgi:single-strand DNA-binding protein
MPMLNSCILTGNLGADVEMFYTSDGKPVATFSLAFRFGKDKTGWIKVSCFNKLAEVCEKFLHKGAKIAVIGSLDQEKWETQSGESRTAYKLVAHSLEFIKTDGRGFAEGENHDDLPF